MCPKPFWEAWCIHVGSPGYNFGTILHPGSNLENHPWACTHIPSPGRQNNDARQIYHPAGKNMYKCYMRLHCWPLETLDMLFMIFWVNFGAPDPSIRAQRRSLIDVSFPVLTSKKCKFCVFLSEAFCHNIGTVSWTIVTITFVWDTAPRVSNEGRVMHTPGGGLNYYCEHPQGKGKRREETCHTPGGPRSVD